MNQVSFITPNPLIAVSERVLLKTQCQKHLQTIPFIHSEGDLYTTEETIIWTLKNDLHQKIAIDPVKMTRKSNHISIGGLQ